MTRHQSIGRRNVLQAAGGIALTGVLAGCLSLINEPESIESWLSETENYEGTIKDKTGTSSVAVTVGPDEEGDGPSPTSGNETRQQGPHLDQDIFAPAAIKISPGTTVTWKWEGYGGHNVVATDRQFDSGEAKPDGTFTHTFESTSKHYYYCEPHKESGMKGVVVVVGYSVWDAQSVSSGTAPTIRAIDDLSSLEPIVAIRLIVTSRSHAGAPRKVWCLSRLIQR